MSDRHLWEYQAVRDAAAIAALIGLVVLGEALSLVTVPLLVALGLAYLVAPLLAAIQRRCPRLGRGGSLTVVLGGILAVSLLAALLVVPPLVRQGAELANNAPGYLKSVADWSQAPARPNWLRNNVQPIAALVQSPAPGPRPSTVPPPMLTTPAIASEDQRIRSLVRDEMARSRLAAPQNDQPLSGLRQMFPAVAEFLAGMLGGLAQLVIAVGVAAFAFLSFSLNWPRVVSALDNQIPPASQPRVRHLVKRMDRVVASFVRGRLIIAALVGMIYATGWTLCGVPYGLILGLVVGVLSLIPYLAAIGLPIAWALLLIPLLGATDASTSWYLAAGANGEAVIVWWKVLVFPLLVNVIAQTIEDYVLTPLIQGQATDLHPLAIMAAVIAAGSVLGLYGMLLAVPAVACIRILGEEVLLPRLRAWLNDATAKTHP